jgi:nucleotide-binding universal stress UspA family protein
MASAPNSATDTLVTSEDWTRAFAQIPKPRKRGAAPVLATACVMGEKLTTFGAVNAGTVAVTEAIRPDGRYPATNEVFPSKPPVAIVAVDPHLLSKVLDLAADIATDDGGRRVLLEVRDSNTPIVIRAKTLEHSQQFTGLVMPLTLEKKEAAQLPDLPKEIADLRQTLDRMRESRDMHAEEAKAMQTHLDSSREQHRLDLARAEEYFTKNAADYAAQQAELASMRADLDTARQAAAQLADQLAECRTAFQAMRRRAATVNP